MKSISLIRFACLSLLSSLVAGTAPAATLYKANTTNLVNAADWTNNLAPGVTDTCSYYTGSTIALTNSVNQTLGGNLSISNLYTAQLQPILIKADGNTLTLNATNDAGFGTAGTCAIDQSSGSTSMTIINCPITLAGNATFRNSGGGWLTLGGAIGETGGSKSLVLMAATSNGQPGSFGLMGVNSYSGGTYIGRLATATTTGSGTLVVLGSSATLGASGSALTMSASGNGTILDLGGTTQTLGAVNFGSASTVQNGTLNGTNFSGYGVIFANLGGSGAPYTLNNNNQRLILSGNNTYTGGTTNTAGTLLASKPGALPLTGTINLSGGANSILAINAGGTGQWGSSDLTSLLTYGSLIVSSSATLGIDTTGGNFSYGSAIAGPTPANLALTKQGPNTLTLTGANTYQKVTTINRGTLLVDNTAGGSLYSSSPLTFTGSGIFNYNTASTAQGLGALTLSGGEGTVQLTRSGTATLTFASLAARTVGKTANFSFNGNTPSATDGIKLTGVTADFINQGTFYNGMDFAYQDSSRNFLRSPVYGTDSGFTTTNTITSGTHTLLTASPAAQNSIGLNTLKLAGNGINWTNNASQVLTLTNGGILSCGGNTTNTISGGYVQTMTNQDLVVRADSASDALTLNSIGGAAVPPQNGTFTTNTAVITGLTSTNNMYVGMTVLMQVRAAFGANTPSTTIKSIDSATQITVNNNFALPSGTSNLFFGGNALTKSGAGTLTLTGTNTFVNVNLNGGQLNINSTNALGIGTLPSVGGNQNLPGTFTINEGTTIDNTSGAALTTANYNLTLNGSFTFVGSSDLWFAGASIGTLAIPNDLTITTVTLGKTLKLGPGLPASGARLTKAGPGTLQYDANGSMAIMGGLNVYEGVFASSLGNSYWNSLAAGPMFLGDSAAGNSHNAVIDLVNCSQQGSSITVNAGSIGTLAFFCDGSPALESLLVLNNNLTLAVPSGQNLNCNGLITGSGNLNIGVPSGGLASFTVFGVTKSLTNVGTIKLSNVNSFTGNTIINSGTLALGSLGSINNSTNISIRAGTTYDVSALSPYTLSTNNILNASGTGIAAGTYARIIGSTNGGVNLRSQPLNLTFTPTSASGDIAHPSLYVSQGILTLNGNIITVTNLGPALGAGTYYLVQVAAGTITGAPSTGIINVLGNGLQASLAATASVSGGYVIMTVAQPPTKLAFTAVPTNASIGAPFNVTVTAQDAGGIARAVTANTTVTLTKSGGSGTLGGTLSGVITAGSSSVTISGVTYDTAETIALTATATAGMSLTAATSSSITFTLPPTKLAITSVNGGTDPYWGVPFNVVVQAQDGSSVARPVVSNTVVSLSINTGVGTLNTPLTNTMVAGTSSVTISNVIYNPSDTGVKLTAARTSGDNLTNGVSAAFNVLASSAKSILTFNFPGYGNAIIAGTNVSITLPAAAVVTSLAPTYTVSSFAAGSPVSGTARDFTTPQTYVITAQDGSQQAYRVAVNLLGSFYWTNNISDNWSGALNWTNDFSWGGAPASAGSETYALNFNQSGTYTANQDLNNGFLLNQLNFGGATLTLNGNSLAFTNNGGSLPQMNQNSTTAVAIANNLTLGAATTLGGSGSAAVTINGVISGSGSLTKNTTVTLTINNITNTYTGGTTINAGTVAFSAGTGATTPQLGTGPITLNSPATLGFNRTTLTNSLTLNGGTVTAGNGFGSTVNGPVNLLAPPTFNVTAGSLVINGNVSGPAGFTFTGGTSLTLSGSNTFAGPVVISSGTLNVGSLNSVVGGTPKSNLGTPTNAAGGTISLGSTTTAATLLYTGAGETTDRILQLVGTTNGATINQSGAWAGLLKFTSNLSIPGTVGADNRKTLTLKNTLNDNNGYLNIGRGELAGNIGDSLQGNPGQLSTSVTMAGVGVWTLSGSNTYSGTTKVQAGTLVFAKAAALGTNTLDITDGAKVQLDYFGIRQIGALTFNGGAAQPNGNYGSSSSTATTKDDVHFSGLGTITIGPINAPTTNTLVLSSGSNPSTVTASLTFTATVTGGNSPSGTVVFYDGLTPLGTNVLNGSAQAAFTTSLLAGGAHSLVAFYTGNASNAPSASATLTQTVNDSRPATTITVARTAGTTPSAFGATVSFTATVTGASPTGLVNFYDVTNLLGSSALNGSGQAVFTTTNLSPGWRGIMAGYAGDANNAPSATTASLWQTVKAPSGNGKLKVFILAGQSNMQGKGEVQNGGDPNNPGTGSVLGGLGSLRGMLNSNTNKYGYLVDTNGYANTANTTVPGWRTLTNVWVSYFTTPGGGAQAGTNEVRKGYLDADFGNGSKQGEIGPEYGFGLVVGSQLGDPVLIIKTAWGGNSLAWNFRPPSSGVNNVSPVGINALGDAYSNMVVNVRYILNNLTNELTNFSYNVANGYELVGFGWHQGWNDIGEPKEQYETNLVNLIRDIRTEFGVPNLPFVIETTGMSSASGSQLLICAAQAAVANPVLHPEFAGTVLTVDTRYFDYGLLNGPTPSQGYHWYHNGQSYFNVGYTMGQAMMQLLSVQAAVTNSPAAGVTTNAAALGAGVIWPFAPCSGVVYWDTIDRGTNVGLWANSAVANIWSNTVTTYQYGWPGDYVFAGGTIPNLAATNLGYTATGLTPNTTYYFNFAATNLTVSGLTLTNGSTIFSTNSQTLWAPSSQSFNTLSVSIGTPPTPLLPGNAITVTGGTPSFTFATVAGYKYRLVYKNALTDANWSPVINPPNYPSPDGWSATSTGAAMTITDTGTVGQPQRFYRIEAANP